MTPHPQSVHSLRGRRKVVPDCAVRIDRATPYGNPFVIGRDGDRAAVVAKYRDMIENDLELQESLRAYVGAKCVICWCHERVPDLNRPSPDYCHGDVVLDVL